MKYIDPNTLFEMLKKFADGGPYYTEDPSVGGINLNSPFAQGAFDNQFQITNPFGQPSNQIQIGNQDFGTPQDTRPLVYDWSNNPEGHDSYMNSLLQKDNLSPAEEKYRRENWSSATSPNLQNPNRKDYTNIFGAQNSVGNKSIGGNSFNNGPSGGSYKSRSEISADYFAGRLDDTQYDILRKQFEDQGSAPRPTSSLSEGDPRIDKKGRLLGGSLPNGSDGAQNDWERLLRSGLVTSPGGLDMEGALYNLGKGIGAEKGTKGKGALIATAALSAIMKGGRTVLSGVGTQKVNDETQRWYEEQLRRRDYTPDSQSQDNNYVGGYFGKDGGTVMNGLQAYLDGGGEPLGGGTNSSEAMNNNTIYSVFDPRYKEYKALMNRQKALEEYKKWHATVTKANPRTGQEFEALNSSSDSLRIAEKYLPRLSNPTEPLWVNPVTGVAITKKLDQTPVTNPYALKVPPTPWGDDRSKGNEFRAWVNKNHPDKAKAWNLETTGNPDNLYSRSAYYELGKEYEDSMKPKTAPKPGEQIQTSEPRVATKMQTVIHPDGRRELRQVPYWNYDTRQEIALPGGAAAIYVDENGQPIQKQKYGGVFGYEGGGQHKMPDGSMMAGETHGDATTGYAVGQHVEFEYGGKMVAGKIKKIENGQIYI